MHGQQNIFKKSTFYDSEGYDVQS